MFYTKIVDHSRSENMATLYCLINPKRKIVKIGYTESIKHRIGTFNYNYRGIDYENSMFLCGDYSEILMLEGRFHLFFNEHRKKQNKTLSGFTEWFDIIIYDKVKNLFKELGENYVFEYYYGLETFVEEYYLIEYKGA
jgi:hypothetical protein